MRSRLCTITLFFALVSTHGARAQPFSSRCGAGVHVDEANRVIVLPQGSLFCPLAADPKEARTFVSYQRGDFATIANPGADPETNIGAIGLGDSFGLLRLPGLGTEDGLQLDVAGAIFAQFNLDEPSFDLINTDYIIGLPLTFRRTGFTARLRLYHQSSHLGDEFLLSREPERVNLSFESIELILSQEIGPIRVYAGGEKFFRREPAGEVASRLAHAGVEARPLIARLGRLVAALDVKLVDPAEDVDGQTAWSARAGFEVVRIPSQGHPARVISLLAEWYDGPAPYGQFYRDDISYFGFGLHFSL